MRYLASKTVSRSAHQQVDHTESPDIAGGLHALLYPAASGAPARKASPMSRRTDLAGSLLITLFGAVVVIIALRAPAPTLVYDAIGPMGFPLVLGSGLVLLGLLQSGRTALAIRSSGLVGAAEGTEDEAEHPASSVRGLMFMVGSFAYILLLEPVGYLIATFVALVTALTAMHYRGRFERVILSLVATVLGFVVFVEGLGVPLPNGVLTDLLLHLGLVDYR